MNIFAGTFTLLEKKDIPKELDYDFIKISDTSYFVVGGDESFQSSKDVVSCFEKYLGSFVSCDISIESEDSLEILSEDFSGEVIYECVSFEGPEVHFDSILERFAESGDVVCVREAEASKRFQNRIIRVDFLY